jgi:PKD repeat protein
MISDFKYCFLFLSLLINSQILGQLLIDGFDYPVNPPNADGWKCSQEFANLNNDYGGYHAGEDWWNSDCYNKPVFSIGIGKVVHAETGGGCWLKVIMIEHIQPEGKIISLYGHLKSTYCPELDKELSVGDIVNRGWEIGRIGYPYCGGPHLHFEIRNENHNSLLVRGTGYLSESPQQYMGYEPPSTYIENYRSNNIKVGEFDFTFENRNTISTEVFIAYITNGGFEKIGSPVDNGGGPYVHPYIVVVHAESNEIFLQDFKCKNDTTTICYNPNLKKAFYLKGCIGFLWWKNASYGLRYQNLLGLPLSNEIISDDYKFETMQHFENGKIYWRQTCINEKDNVKIVFSDFLYKEGCLACLPKVDLSICDCENSLSIKSAYILPDCEALFTAEYTKKTSWDFGKEETLGWSSRNANDMGYHEDWYWMIDPVKDPDPVSGSGIVSPPFLNSINTSTFDKLEVRAACKSQFIGTLQLHLLINGKWQSPLLLKCVSPNEEQLPNNQCIYRGDILYPGQIQQFRIDFIEGSDVVDDRIFIDYVHFLEGENPVPTLKAGFSSDVQFGKYPLTVSFTDSSIFKDVSTEVQYSWNFGDGSMSFESSPIHVYSIPGEYTVSLKISSGIFNDSIIKNGFVRVYDSSPVTNMEYFFDRDPGQGNGNPVVFTLGEDFTQSFYINYNDLTEGYHKLYVRAKHAGGKWGSVSSKDFYAVNLSNIPYITQMEYFFDTDPGFGKGKSISVNDYFHDKIEQNITLDFGELDEGYHTLYVRFKDNQGNWGLYAKTPFYRITESNQSNIVEIEYFIDDDPGIGKAQVEKVTPTQILTHNFFIDRSELLQGVHTMGVRVKNAYSEWSETKTKEFFFNIQPIADAGANQTVNEGETVTLDGSNSYDPDGDPLTYRWTVPDEITLSSSTAAQPTFIAPEVLKDTVFIITLEVFDGTNYSVSDQVEILIKNNIDVGSAITILPGFKIFTNPSTGVFTIQLQNAADFRKIEMAIFNLLGKIVYQQDFYSSGEYRIDLSEQASGIYLIHCTTNKKKQIKKLVVNKMQ